MKLPDFRYVPHTADVAFIAYGPNLKGVIENSSRAMLSLMFDVKGIDGLGAKAKTIRISEKAPNEEELIWFTLQDIVSEVDERGVNAFKFKVNRLSRKKGMYVLHGCIFYKKTDRYLALLDVKGVTPHELDVRKSGGRWRAKVVVDV